MKWNDRYKKILICALLFIGALGLRAHELNSRTLSNDEMYQFQSSAGPFKPFWLRHHYGDFSSFPGDYILTYPFIKIFAQQGIAGDALIRDYALAERVAEANKWFLAIPHVLSAILLFYFLYLLCNRYYRTIWGYLVAFSIVCLNQTLIFQAFEFRSYAVLPALAVGTLYFTELLMEKYKEMSLSRKLWISAFLIFVVIFHVYGILFIGLSVIYALFLNWHKGNLSKEIIYPIIKFFGVFFVFAIAIWLWYASINLGFSQEKRIFFGAVPTFEFIPSPVTNLVGFLKGILGNLIGNKALYFLLLGMLASLLIPHKDKWPQIVFFAVFIVFGIGCVIAIDLINKYWFLQRQFGWTMPLFAFFLGWCWDVSAQTFYKKIKTK
ncbi:MAG: hypothetical protein WC676_00470 [Candidatus Omnitrophota bacterium]